MLGEQAQQSEMERQVDGRLDSNCHFKSVFVEMPG